MTYNTDFTRLTFGGSLADGNEIWNCGFALGYNPEDTDWSATTYGIKDDITDLIKDFWSDGTLSTPHGATLEYVKYAHVGTDGKYMEAPIVDDFAAVHGAQTGAYVPQISTVVTLFTDKYKDPGKYNRFYLPFGSLSGTDVYELPVIEQDRLLTAAQTLFNSIAAMTITGGYVRVNVVTASGASGTPLKAVGVKVGRVLDTQRRRRNKLPEAYKTLGLTVPA
uniref:Uncharacterized protein n=1 Tax=uncultured prokaryote TaxID=198431 RepID=A0A0H5QPZ0_9ZZZZ|nr:hypothetical protein [uncultured prokaryote]